MDSLIIGLQAQRIAETRRNMKVTVLHRPNGIWHQQEVNRLCNGLMTEVSQKASHPEHLVLFGHFTKQQTLDVLIGGMAYTATQITGINDSRVPFVCFV